MGEVYEAIHVDLKKRVVLKTLRAMVADDAQTRARFQREGELAARVHHPHVVDVTDLGVEGNTPFLVMEFLEGEDLESLLSREGQLSPTRTADLLLPILAALVYAHEQEIIHRDLKPANIFLARTPSGEVVPKLLDFGLSKLVAAAQSEQITAFSMVLGTPDYMSPEQTRSSQGLGATTDQYTFGVILYQCVTGQLPFPQLEGETVYDLLRRIVAGTFTAPCTLVPELPAAFEAIILRAMQLQPDDRFASTRELGSALIGFASPRTRIIWEHEFDSRTVLSQVARGPESPAASALLAAAPAAPAGVTSPGAVATAPVPPTRPVVAAAASRSPTEKKPDAVGPASSPFRWVLGAAGLGLLAVVAVGVLKGHGPRAPEVPEPQRPSVVLEQFIVQVTAEPAQTLLTLDGKLVGTGTLSASLPRDGVPHRLELKLAGYVPQVLAFVDQPPAAHVTLVPVPAPVVEHKPRPAPAAMVITRILTFFQGQAQWAHVSIDGLALADTAPLTVSLAAGKHHIVVSHDGVGQASQDVVVEAAKVNVFKLELHP
jgi:serine/threonine-protein kinase